MYVKVAREDIDERCPRIDNPAENKTDTSQFPLHAFQQGFAGKFRTGSAVDDSSNADDPLRLLLEKPLEDAVALYVSCHSDARNEQSRHTCRRCLIQNPVTNKYIYVMCGDGVSLTRHCCAHGQSEDEACKNHPVSARKRTCLAHAYEDAYCAISDCLRPIHREGSYTCDNQRCKDIFVTWVASRESVRLKLRMFIREQGSAGARRKIPELIRQSMLSDRVKAALQQVAAGTINIQTEGELLELLISKADQVLAAEVGIKHGFSRRFTHMEFTLSRVCGHLVHRSTCHRSESLAVVRKALLVATNGATRFTPTHFVYDRACSHELRLARMLERADPDLQVQTKHGKTFNSIDLRRLWTRTSNIVDRFHWEKHKHGAHPNLEVMCKEFCNPEDPGRNQRNVDLFDADGKLERSLPSRKT